MWEAKTSLLKPGIHVDHLPDVTWQNIKEGTDITSLEDMCKNSEIYYAKYDSESSQFVDVRQVSDNATLDMGPKFALQESADQPLTIVWQRNSVDDIFGLMGRNSIVYSTFDEGNWSVPNILDRKASCRERVCQYV